MERRIDVYALSCRGSDPLTEGLTCTKDCTILMLLHMHVHNSSTFPHKFKPQHAHPVGLTKQASFVSNEFLNQHVRSHGLPFSFFRVDLGAMNLRCIVW